MIDEPYLYNFGRCLAPPGWNFTKMRDCNRIYVVYSGSGWYFDGETQRQFLPGNIYLLPIKSNFRAYQLDSDPLDHMFFDFSLTPPLRSGKAGQVDLSSAANDHRLAALRYTVKALEELLSDKNHLHMQENTDTIKALFPGLLRQLCTVTGYTFSRDPRIESVMDRIHATHPDGSLDIPDNEELASLLHLDISHFIRLFRREVGITPYQYIRSHRLNVASAYISSGTSVTDAARFVGYESVSALSHALAGRK